MITGCGGVKSEAKDIYEDYFIGAGKICVEYSEEATELLEKYKNKKINRIKLNKKFTKIVDNAVEDLDELKFKLDDKNVNEKNKNLASLADTYIWECKRFVAISEEHTKKFRGLKSKIAIKKQKDLMYDAGNNFIREYNRITGERITYLRKD